MSGKVLYSTILQHFADPILDADDTDEIFMKKIKVAEIIWNYCIAREFQLPVFDELHNIITDESDLEAKILFDTFIKIKTTYFDEYKKYIGDVELRKNSQGIKTLHVTSIEPEDLKTILNMSKLGTKEKPAVVKVQTEKRAMEIMALCNSNSWEVIVGIEPDEAENIDDIKKLGSPKASTFKFNSPPSRNSPCSCGSGKQYKRCCGK